MAATVVLVLWGLITHGTFAGSGDEAHYRIITHSIAFDRDLSLANNYADRDSVASGAGIEIGAHALRGRHGHLRPVHDIGMPLLASPYYTFAHFVAEYAAEHVPQPWFDRARLNGGLILRHLMSFAMIGLAAWIGVALFGLFGAFSGAPHRAAAWAILLALSPPILSHAFLFFTEVPSALVVLLVFRRLRSSVGSPWAAMLLGAATGALMLIHVRNVGLVMALTLLGVYQLSQRSADLRGCALFVAGMASALAVRVGVTYHFWGSYLTTPHARFGEFEGLAPAAIETARRIFGWLFDQEHGLLLYSPIYSLVPLGLWVLWKRNRDLFWQVSVVVGLYVVLMALPMINAHGWRGGWSPAGRFLVPVAPLLGVCVYAAVVTLPRGSWAVRTVALLQVAINAYLWQNPKLLWNAGDGTSSFLTHLSAGSTALTSRLPAIGPELDAGSVSAVAIIVAVWVTFTIWLSRRAATTERSGCGGRSSGSPGR